MKMLNMRVREEKRLKGRRNEKTLGSILPRGETLVKPHDIFVIKMSGLPLFAGCSCGPSCAKCADQHDLQSGFIAAIVSFCREVFSHSVLKAVLLDDLQLNFKLDLEMELIFVVTHGASVPRGVIQEQLDQIVGTFISKYRHYLVDDVVQPQLFNQFREDLYQLGILPDQEGMRSILDQQHLKQDHQRDKPNLWTWLKKKLNRNSMVS